MALALFTSTVNLVLKKIGSSSGLSLSKRSTEGMALASVLVILLVFTGIGVLAMSSSLNQRIMAGKKKGAASMHFVAKEALDTLQRRMHKRMNPGAVKGDGTYYSVDELKKMVPAPGDLHPTTGQCNGHQIDGDCWHGYRFQTATNMAPAPPPGTDLGQFKGYIRDFIWESAVNRSGDPTGVFGDCTVENGCAIAEGAEWEVKLIDEWEIPMTGDRSIDLRGDGESDLAHQFLVQITAYNSKTGERSAVQADFVVVAPFPSTNKVFATGANVISYQSLFSGYIQGAVAQFLDEDRIPLDQNGAKAPLELFEFADPSFIHFSCEGGEEPCASNSFAMGRRPVQSSNFFHNMMVGGVVTNMGYNHLLNSTNYGLRVDDGRAETGDFTNHPTIPPDVLQHQDLTVVAGRNDISMGKNEEGVITDDGVNLIASMIDPSSSAQIRTSNGGNCIETNDGTPNSFNPTHELDSTKHRGNVVFKPGGACEIQITGSYTIDGDVIIAGDENGLFDPQGADNRGQLFVTGNVYILNDITVKNGPALNDGFNDPTNRNASVFRSDGYSADANATAFDQLSIVTPNHVVIGNLTNSNSLAHIMTNVNRELTYFNQDFDGDDSVDFLVSDGYRPSSSDRTLQNFQIDYQSCPELLGAGLVETCQTNVAGLFPAGASGTQDKYKFDIGLDHLTDRSGEGYVRADPAHFPQACENTSGDTVLCGGIGEATSTWFDFTDGTTGGSPPGQWESSRVNYDSDVFGSGSWISTENFRALAKAPIIPDDPWHQHDSKNPDFINRVNYISAKIKAGGAIVGLANWEDASNFDMNDVVNPDAAMGHFYGDDQYRALNIIRDVNNPDRYNGNVRCTSYPPAQAANNPPAYLQAASINDPNVFDFRIPPPPPCVDSNNDGTCDAPGQCKADANGICEAPSGTEDPNTPGPDLTRWSEGIPVPRGIDVFGGLYGSYINILSPAGLCIYHDDRETAFSHEPIFVLPGGMYVEDLR